MQNNLVIQKLPGYQKDYLLLGGQQPKLINRDSINKSIEVLKNQLQLQHQILNKMNQLDESSKKVAEPTTENK